MVNLAKAPHLRRFLSLAVLLAAHASRFTTPSAHADDLAPAAGAGIELSLLDRISNGTSETGFMIADYLTLGVGAEGSLELAESVRGFAGFTPVFRLMDTDLGVFEGYRWDLGVTVEIDESLYAKGSLRFHSVREEVAGRTHTINSFGLNPRLGYRFEVDPDLFWLIEGGLPLLFVTDKRHLPELLVVTGIEKKF